MNPIIISAGARKTYTRFEGRFTDKRVDSKCDLFNTVSLVLYSLGAVSFRDNLYQISELQQGVTSQ